MKMILNHETLTAWHERFISFNDAVLQSLSVKFSVAGSVLEVLIETQDRESPSGWSLVLLRLSGVTSLKFSDGPRASYQVLSNGLHTILAGGLVGLEFGDFIDTPQTVQELMYSPCHAVGEMLEWNVQSVQPI